VNADVPGFLVTTPGSVGDAPRSIYWKRWRFSPIFPVHSTASLKI